MAYQADSVHRAGAYPIPEQTPQRQAGKGNAWFGVGIVLIIHGVTSTLARSDLGLFTRISLAVGGTLFILMLVFLIRGIVIGDRE